MTDELNIYGVFLGDIYLLNFYGVLAFFYVSKTREDTVFLTELGTKKYKNGVMFTKGMKAAKKPLIIVKNNTFRKTTYEVTPNKDLTLPIIITPDLPIYKKALKRTDLIYPGTYTAYRVLDYYNKYWVAEENMPVNSA
ncbi:MAG: hypothetical protein K5765_06665 [Clostridia bacterium]|nr:hypothetical protein [Clostridia bacterium]